MRCVFHLPFTPISIFYFLLHLAMRQKAFIPMVWDECDTSPAGFKCSLLCLLLIPFSKHWFYVSITTVSVVTIKSLHNHHPSLHVQSARSMEPCHVVLMMLGLRELVKSNNYTYILPREGHCTLPWLGTMVTWWVVIYRFWFSESHGSACKSVNTCKIRWGLFFVK